jgi:hypothetical protein
MLKFTPLEYQTDNGVNFNIKLRKAKAVFPHEPPMGHDYFPGTAFFYQTVLPNQVAVTLNPWSMKLRF